MVRDDRIKSLLGTTWVHGMAAMEQLAPTQRSRRNSDDPDCPGGRARIRAVIKL
jgi:hypothetical protein